MPRVLSFFCAAIALLALPTACAERAPQPSVLLVTIDTLRADALGAYGAHPSPSPNFDALATQSTLYEHALAPLPMTRPSHFSLFTSRYPRQHGVLNNRLALPETELTLAEVFSESGYRTGAFTAVAILGPSSGVGQGFDALSPPTQGRQRPANGVVQDALDWIGSPTANEPFFAWVHLFDPHQPYELLDPDLGDVDAAMLADLPQVEWPDLYRVAGENDGDIPLAVLEHTRSLYRAEVAWADRWLGRLLDGVGAVRDLDDVLVVVTADHGECFENGVYFEHSDCLQQAALRVPLIIRHPRSFEAGARIASVVSHLDVAPTLLAAAGIEVPPSFVGTALQLLDGDDRQVLVQYPFYQRRAVEGRLAKRKGIKSVAGEPMLSVIVDEEKVGVVTGDWKYLRSGSTEELYRLGSAADESRNVVADQEAVRGELSAALDAMIEAHPLVLLDSSEINDELRATLEALGYIQ